MRRARITITLNQKFLKNIDSLIDQKTIRNRSHAIEYILGKHFEAGIKKAVILAGGRSAKFLLPINGQPIIAYLIENLKNSHICDIIICTNHFGKKIKDYFGNGKNFGVKITYSHEDETLQTGGALLKIKKLIDDQPFILLHGDVLTDFPLNDLISFHLEEKPLVTVALTSVNKPESFGQMKLHGTQLVNFYQKNHSHKIRSHLINTGIYAFDPSVFGYFPENKKSFLLEDIIEKLIKKSQVNGFVFEDQWFDVGDPKNYNKAIKEFKISRPQNQK